MSDVKYTCGELCTVQIVAKVRGWPAEALPGRVSQSQAESVSPRLLRTFQHLSAPLWRTRGALNLARWPAGYRLATGRPEGCYPRTSPSGAGLPEPREPDGARRSWTYRLFHGDFHGDFDPVG